MTNMQPIPDAAIDQYGIGVFFLCRVFCRTDLIGESSDASTDEGIEGYELWCVGAVSDREATEECVGLTCGVCVAVDECMGERDLSGAIPVDDKVREVDDLLNDNFELAGWNLFVTSEDIGNKESRDADTEFEETACEDSRGLIDVWAYIDRILLE